jgi:uncharacterized membrane protein YphA (DoxX/SURF4 family)
MLSIFPIHFLSLVAYLLLRLAVGFVFFSLAKTHYQNRAVFAEKFTLPSLPYGRFFVWHVICAELVIGTLFILGLYTQIAALLAVAYAAKFLIMHRRFGHPLGPSRQTLILLLFAALSLFITGPGIFAFDLPI